MKITQEEFNTVDEWYETVIPPDDWPNPRATKEERTFYVGKMQGFVRHVIRKPHFDRLMNGSQTTT